MAKLKVTDFYIDETAFFAKRFMLAKMGTSHPGTCGVSAVLIRKCAFKYQYFFAAPMPVR